MLVLQDQVQNLIHHIPKYRLQNIYCRIVVERRLDLLGSMLKKDMDMKITKMLLTLLVKVVKQMRVGSLVTIIG